MGKAHAGTVGSSPRSHWLLIARLAWVVLISASVGMFLLALPPRFEQLLADPYQLRTGLEMLGLTTWHFAVYGVGIDILAAVGFIGFAVLLFVKGSQEWMALLLSLAIGQLIILVLPVTSVLPGIHPAWQYPQQFLRGVSFSCFSAALLLFPDGKLSPRWIQPFFWGLIGYGLLWPIFPSLAPISGLDFRVQPSIASVLFLVGICIIMIAFQVYRYRNFYSPAQRQQTSWVVFGIIFAFTTLILVIIPGIFWEPVRNSPLAYTLYILIGVLVVLLCTLLFPLSLAIAILHHRLWDLDLVIRRTLAYSMLSGLLTILYFSGIALMQGLLTGDVSQPSPIVIVASTLAIAALFNPMRKRFQDFIDRRFYRQKYDAEKALETFAAAARSETDLEVLDAELLSVVQETMQPESIHLWFIRKEALRAGGK